MMNGMQGGAFIKTKTLKKIVHGANKILKKSKALSLIAGATGNPIASTILGNAGYGYPGGLLRPAGGLLAPFGAGKKKRRMKK